MYIVVKHEYVVYLFIPTILNYNSSRFSYVRHILQLYDFELIAVFFIFLVIFF